GVGGGEQRPYLGHGEAGGGGGVPVGDGSAGAGDRVGRHRPAAVGHQVAVPAGERRQAARHRGGRGRGGRGRRLLQLAPVAVDVDRAGGGRVQRLPAAPAEEVGQVPQVRGAGVVGEAVQPGGGQRREGVPVSAVGRPGGEGDG